MICLNCQRQLPDDSRFCDNCGNPISPEPPMQQSEPEPEQEQVYAPPEGFEYDFQSLLYYRSEYEPDGTQWVTWFDPNTGEYEAINYLAEQTSPEQGVVSEPVYIPEPEPEPEPSPEQHTMQAHPPQIDIPDGFTLDPNSGLYYKVMPGKNPTTGGYGQWYTWFYPETGDFQQQFYPD